MPQPTKRTPDEPEFVHVGTGSAGVPFLAYPPVKLNPDGTVSLWEHGDDANKIIGTATIYNGNVVTVVVRSK